MGLQTELIETKKHPIVYAEWLGAPGKPTILIYGHYDVQPPEPLEPWLSPPFEPTVRDGNLYARGSHRRQGPDVHASEGRRGLAEDFGQAAGQCQVLDRGRRGGRRRQPRGLLARDTQKLACDFAVISDSSQFAPGQPAITYGLKGLAYFELLVQGANRDLHSGTYGGAVANPLNALATILASLKGPDGKIQIAGFYDAVKPLEDWERAEFAKLPFSEAEFQADLQVPVARGRGRLHDARAQVGPADVRHQRHLRRLLPGPAPRRCFRARRARSSASAWFPTKTPRRSSGSSGSTSPGSARRA